MYVDAQLTKETKQPSSFWANTSGNEIIIEYLKRGRQKMKQEFDLLVNKGAIIKTIRPEITYREIDEIDNIYSFLLFSGYLKIVNVVDEYQDIYTLVIPNEEVRKVYIQIFNEQFEKYKVENKNEFIHKLIQGDEREVEEILLKILEKSISYYDNKESFYHGFLVGMLQGIMGYDIYSNKESGEGRFDIVLRPESIRKKAIIIECKHAIGTSHLRQDSKEALQQIQDKKYVERFIQEGYEGYIGYGIAFYKKQCFVTSKEV